MGYELAMCGYQNKKIQYEKYHWIIMKNCHRMKFFQQIINITMSKKNYISGILMLINGLFTTNCKLVSNGKYVFFLAFIEFKQHQIVLWMFFLKLMNWQIKLLTILMNKRLIFTVIIFWSLFGSKTEEGSYITLLFGSHNNQND